MLEEDDPPLEAKAVRTLEGLPVKVWWRTGRHTEFGPLTILQTVSCCTAHEGSHGAQFDALLADG